MTRFRRLVGWALFCAARAALYASARVLGARSPLAHVELLITRRLKPVDRAAL